MEGKCTAPLTEKNGFVAFFSGGEECVTLVQQSLKTTYG